MVRKIKTTNTNFRCPIIIKIQQRRAQDAGIPVPPPARMASSSPSFEDRSFVDLNSSCCYQKSNELDTYGCKKYGSCGKVVCENPNCMYTMGCVYVNSTCTYQK